MNKEAQMNALRGKGVSPFLARMAGQEREPFESEEGFPMDVDDESDESLGSRYHRPLEAERDESEASHVGRLGDQALDNPEPKLANKARPYGSDDGENPRQSAGRGERSPGSIVNRRIARSEKPGGKGLLTSGSAESAGSDQGTGRLSAGRDERASNLGRLGKAIPAGGYRAGAGARPAGPKKG